MSQILDKFSLKGQSAVVTGGAGLLGKEFCRTLAQAGAGVIVADLIGEAAEKTAEALRAEGLQALACAVDVTRPDSSAAMVAAAVEAFGRLDVIVNSAAMDPKFDATQPGKHASTFEDYPLEMWQQALDVNLTGVFLCCQAAARQMVAQGGKGSIINICSTYGLVPPDQRIYEKPGQPKQFKPAFYTTTKAGVLGLTKYIASYYAGTLVRANCLTPGGVYNNHDETFTRNYAYRTIMGRMAERDEMNGALLFLASEASAYMTGGNVVVDGGLDGMVDAEVLAIIPARGGSKGIPRKNIKAFAGHALIAYSIEAGLQAKNVNRVIVSTDDEEIAAVARAYGAETPFLRPEEIAQDRTLDLPVFQHALEWLAEHEGYRPDVLVQLRPTSPVRPPELVDLAVETLLAHPEAESVRGVVPAGQNPHKMWRIDAESGRMKNLLDVPGIAEPYNAPRQMLPVVYWQTGHIDAVRAQTVRGGSMSGDVILPVRVDPAYTVDIDTPKDWARSEWLVWYSDLEIVYPGKRRRPLPERVDLVVFDFDGVLTDNRVWVDETGREMVAAYRSDSMGTTYLRQKGVKMVVLSTEVNPVVAARCAKMKIPVHQGISDKAGALPGILDQLGVSAEHAIYLGNDTNDIPCFSQVACALVVADAEPAARRAADIVLSRKGGHGAVRELCDLLLQRMA